MFAQLTIMTLCWSRTCLAIFSTPAASKERKPWERALLTPHPPPPTLHSAFLDLSLPGVCMGWRVTLLCLTALLWKPGLDCGLCLGLCEAQTLFFSLLQQCYCIGLALTQGMLWISHHIQIYLLWARSDTYSSTHCSAFFKTFFEVATCGQHSLPQQ